MDFRLTEDQQLMVNTIRELMERQVEQIVRHRLIHDVIEDLL